MPQSDANPHSHFWNRMAEGYAKSPIADEAAYQHKLDKTREWFSPRSDVLEFGCGTGGTAVLHAPFVGNYLATDFSSEMLRIAETRKAEAGITNLTFREAELVDFDPVEYQFDAILGLSVLHLLADREATLRHAHALLKPGGVLVTSTVCLMDGFWFLIPIIPIARALRLFPLLKAFSAKRLRREVEAAGFEITYDWRPKPNKALFLIAKKPG